jgi:hypothetical protein
MTEPEKKNDNRGGIFVDFGDGRGPIHQDDMCDEDHIAAFTVPRAREPESADIPPALISLIPPSADTPPTIEES